MTPSADNGNDRRGLEAWALVKAEDHKPEQDGVGCTCGFCVWSVEHVVVMSIREAWGLKAVLPQRERRKR